MKILEQFINQLKEDGVDHVRVDSRANTDLGRMASLKWEHKFEVPGMGEFASPSHFVNWLVSGVDDCRTSSKIRVTSSIPDFRKLTLYAKFYQLFAMRKKLIKARNRVGNLPLVSYISYETGIKQSSTKYENPNIMTSMISYICDLPEKTTIKDIEWNWLDYGSDVRELIKEYMQVILETGIGKMKTNKKPKKIKMVIQDPKKKEPKLSEEKNEESTTHTQTHPDEPTQEVVTPVGESEETYDVTVSEEESSEANQDVPEVEEDTEETLSTEDTLNKYENVTLEVLMDKWEEGSLVEDMGIDEEEEN